MINVLLLGLGNIGQIHLRNLKKNKNLKIFIHDINKKLITNLKDSNISQVDDLNSFLHSQRIDVGIIATSTDSHKDISIQLLKNNIPHLIEKPISTKSSDFEEIFKISNKKDIFVMCGFVERFHTCVVKIKQEIKNQKILSFSSLRNSVPPDESRKLDEVKFDVLIHDLDLFNFIVKDADIKNINIFENGEFANAVYSDKNLVGNFSANRMSHKKSRKINIITDRFEYIVDLLEHKIIKSEHVYVKNIQDIEKPFIKVNENIINVEPSESIFKQQEFLLKNFNSGFDNSLYNSYKFSHYSTYST